MIALPQPLRRRARLAAAALATALAAVGTYLAGLPDDETPAGDEARTLAAPAAPVASAAPPPDAAPAAPAAPPVDLFAVRTWEPPPPPPAESGPPPAPQAPPLPFRFVGRVVEAGRKPAFMLADGERLHVVSVGDPIGQAYRVEKFEKGKLYLRYRPLNTRQFLDVGEEKP